MNTPTDKAKLLLQIRQEGVTDAKLLAAFEAIPRDKFVGNRFAMNAFENRALPIGCGQTISQPSVIAIMTNALEVSDRMKVLEIGTGSGYQTTILARMCRRVYTVERHRDLSFEASRRFNDLAIHNVSTRIGDGYYGWPEQAPFHRIMVTAASAEPPPKLVEQLGDDGIMVLPIGRPDRIQTLFRLRKQGTEILKERLVEVRFVPLVGQGQDSKEDL